MYDTTLIPIDFDHEDLSIKTLQKAHQLLGSSNIIVLHVVEEVPDYILAQFPDDFEQYKISEVTKSLEDIVAQSGVQARVEVRKGISYNSILESAADNKVDLIIINSHRPNFQDYLLGSTAAKVVRHAKCSVLVDR